MTAITECSQGYAALQAFFQAQSQYVLLGGTPPDINAVMGSLSFTELLTFATNNAESSADFQSGSSVEAVSAFASAVREYDMGRMRKSDLISSISSDASSEAAFYGQTGDFFSGVLKGGPTSGSQC